jgi:hypothetical protein
MHSYSNDLLLPYPHKGWQAHYPFIPYAVPFEPSDTEYLYKSNMQRQADTWYYKSHAVTYTWNANGYRASDWVNVDWANSWIIMGCSHVVGIGVAYEDTVGEQLGPMINSPVVNLGMGGSGVDVVMYNSLRLIDAGIRPRGVVVIAPDLARLSIWRVGEPLHLNPHYKTNDPHLQHAYEAWLRFEPNAELQGYMKLRSALALWQAEGVQTVSAYHHPEKDPGHNLGIYLPPRQDWARDIDISNGQPTGHFGRATLGSWARALAEVINQH